MFLCFSLDLSERRVAEDQRTCSVAALPDCAAWLQLRLRELRGVRRGAGWPLCSPPQVPVREQPRLAPGLRHLRPDAAAPHRRGDRSARVRPEDDEGGEESPPGASGLHAQRGVLLHLPGRQQGLRSEVCGEGRWAGSRPWGRAAGCPAHAGPLSAPGTPMHREQSGQRGGCEEQRGWIGGCREGWLPWSCC